ncbi:hypothetical protein COB52_05625 [Candidatus Kaiserbacteria bacterium]|nr:MAG: hypothetical protein COB52_05625 [Candidatus Kaiserbacteria bacterium]
MAAKAHIDRPQRWDVPYDPDMTEEDVIYILGMEPFSNIDQDKFPKSIPLYGVIANETKIRKFNKGDLVMRRGDYGNTAYFIMKGSVRVVIPIPDNVLSAEALGRAEPKTKGIWESISQHWKNAKVSEYRERVQGSVDMGSDGKEVVIALQDVPGIISNKKTAQIPAGNFFGEIAALGRTPRTATIFAEEDGCQILEIKWQGLRELRKYTPSIKEHIDKLYRKNSLTTQLAASPLFSGLNEEELQKVADATHFTSVGDFDWHTSYKKTAQLSAAKRLDKEPIIFDQGAYPDSLVLIRAGFGRVSEVNGNGHRTASYIGKGQTFGLREIAHNWRSDKRVNYRYTLRGLGFTDILVIPAAVIQEHVLPKMKKSELPPLFPEVEPTVEFNPLSASQQQKEKMSKTDVMEFMVEHRYINGTATMLINLDRCTRCDDCVRACATAHDNNPRFVREGKTLGHLMVAHSCQHCQDPVCMIGCPTGAISRKEGGAGEVIINDTTCIGCSTCANSCPYENIRMVEVRSDKGDLIRDDATKMPIVKATKCDLCAEQIGGPSCENACPHDALVRMEMQNPESLMEWIRR